MESRYVDLAKAKQIIGTLTPSDFFNTRTIGFTLQRAWVFLLFLNVGSATLSSGGMPIPGEVYLISSVALCAVLFGAAASPDRFARFMTHPARRWSGPVLTAIGSLLVFLIYVDAVPVEAMGLLAGVLTGIGSGAIDLGYGEIYRNRPPEKANIEVPFATVLAACIYMVGAIAPAVVSRAIVLVLPLASGWLLLASNHVWEPGHEPTVQPVGMDIGKFTWRIGVCAAVVGAADSFVRQVFMNINGLSVSTLYGQGMLTSCVLMFLLFFGYQVLAKEPSYRNLYKLVVFIMAFFFMLIPIVFPVNDIFTCTIALASYNTYNVLIWLVLSDLAYTYRLSSLRVFGIGWGMVTLGVAIGQIGATQVIVSTAAFTSQQVSLIVLIAVMLTIGSYMFVLKEDDMEKMTDEADRDEEAPEAADGSQETAPESQADAAKTAGEKGGGSARAHPTPFRTRCEQVATHYQLTPRETEIMTLFAKGRTSKRIQEELVLSRGTVTTHLQHIYQKVGVHSKQELLDVIEDYHPERQ